MKKTIKAVVFSLIALVSMLITLFILDKTDNKSDKDKNNSATTPTTADEDALPPQSSEILLKNYTKSDITELYINTGLEEYTIIPNGKDGFSVKELDELAMSETVSLPYNQLSLSNAIEAAAQLKARALVEENAAGFDKYNLDANGNNVRITAKIKDGTAFTFLIGDTAPDKASLYMRLDDSNDVYAAPPSTVNHFIRDKYSWLETLLFPAYDTQAAPPIEKAVIRRLDLPEGEITIERLPVKELEESISFNTHIMQPTDVEVDPEDTEPILFGLFGLRAISAVWVAPEQSDLDFTELSLPAATVEITAGDASQSVYTLTIGKEDVINNINGRFVMSSHAPGIIWFIEPEKLHWLTVTPQDLIAEMFLAPYIYSINSVVVTTADGTYTFGITGDSHNNTVSINGEAITDMVTRDRFGDLYRYIISVKGEELYNGETIGELIATVEYDYRDETRSGHTLELFASDNRRIVISLNGKAVYTCREVYAERLLKNLKAFSDNEEIVIEW